MNIAFIVQNLAQLSDSIGYDCIIQFKILTERYGSDGSVRLFADVFDTTLHPGITIEPFADFWHFIEESPNAHVIYHFCDGWEKVDDFIVRNVPNAIIRWHNNTPPWFYVNGNVDFAAGCTRGFDTIAQFARAGSVRFLVNSEFTRRQLHALDGLDADIDTVFPASSFLFRTDARPAPREATDTHRAIELLFVGRVVPHKGHRHILSTAAAVQRFSGRRVKVTFAGSLEARLESYWSDLKDIAVRLDVETVFTGLVSDAELAGLYASCDAFLCMSEHEGFGMPVFEAMRCRVPVVAWSSSALADLLDGHPFAGADFKIHRFAACVLTALEPEVRNRIIALQDHVLEQYTYDRVRAQLLAAMAWVRGRPGRQDAPPRRAMPATDDIVAFVDSLAEWIEQELGAAIETFTHDAAINLMSLYDIGVYERLIASIRTGGACALPPPVVPTSGDARELHRSHPVIRQIMAGDPAPDAIHHLDDLLGFDDEVFVRLAFRTLLGRDADPGALAAYLRRLRQGDEKRAIVDELAGSEEARRFDRRLAGMADAPPATSELSRLRTMEAAIMRLSRFLVPGSGALPPYHPMGSIHHVDDLLRLNDAAFVDVAYRFLLGRAADAGGFDHYTAALDHGMPRRQLLSDLATTEEGARNVGHLEGLTDLLATPAQDDGALPPEALATTLARLANELGRLTNQLVAQTARGTADTGPNPSGSLLRLVDAALTDTGASGSNERCLRALFAGAAEAQASACGHAREPRPDQGEVAIDYIHQILITANGRIPDVMPDAVRHNIDSICNLHPEAQYRLWGADDLRGFIAAAGFDPAVLEAFDMLQAFALKADLARYCLLYVYGGLYSDLSNRFLSRWRIGADKVIGCFREHKPLHGALWMNQNTIIYAAPRQPEIKLAIDLVVENVRNREYGISSLAPSGPVLFGRVVSALGRADRYQIGEAINVHVEGSPNRSSYVDVDGAMIATRLQGGGGRPSEIGLRGTNVYGEMWDRREIYGEGLLFFAHDRGEIVTSASRDANGIHLADGDRLDITLSHLPRGVYAAIWRFTGQSGHGRFAMQAHSGDGRLLNGGPSLTINATGCVEDVIVLETAGDVVLELRCQGGGATFADLTVRRVSRDPAHRHTLPDRASAHDPQPQQQVPDPRYVHHIAYPDDIGMTDAEAAEVAENIRLAAALHPAAEPMVWTDVALRAFIAAQFTADVTATYDRLRTFGNRAELGRYCLLYALGGLYVDPWLRMINPINVPPDKALACFRGAEVENGASWSVDTGLLYAAARQPEFEQLIEQVVASVRTDAYGTMPSSVTGSERLGRILAVTYNAHNYFGGEVVPLTRGMTIVNDGFLSQDGRLIAVRKSRQGPDERARRDIARAWRDQRTYAGRVATTV